MAEALEVQLRADAASFNKGMNEAIASMNRMVSETKKIGGAAQQMTSGFTKMGSTISAAFKGLATGLVAGGLIAAVQQIGVSLAQNAERAENFRASMAALRGSSEQGAQAMTKVYNISQKLGASIGDVSGVFQKLTVALAPLGASNRDIERMTETLFKMGRIGGSSMQDVTGAVLQLSQGLSSGKLQWEELKIIMERMPLLSQSIAKELGVTTGELKKMGSEGKIGVNEVYGAIQKMADEVDQKFAKMPLTIDQAMNNIRTSLSRAFDSPVIIAAVQAIARAINLLPGVIDRASSSFNTFTSNLRRMVSDIGTAFQPAIDKLKEFLGQFSGLGDKVGSALSTFGSILKAALLGPLILIVNNYDQFLAYLTLKVPGELQKMVGSAGGVLADLVKKFEDAWNAIIDLVAKAVNGIIAQINRLSGAMNAVWQSAGGTGDIIPKLGEVDGAFAKVTGTVNGLKAASDRTYRAGMDGVTAYKMRLAELNRATEETGERFRDTNLKAEAFSTTLGQLSTAAVGGGGSGGGGKGGGGAAGGIKKAGDAAKKAAEQMDAAKSQVEEFGQAMQSIAQSLGSGVVDALFSIADGSKSAKEAFTELAKSMLKQIAQMIMQLLILKPLMGMFGGGMGLFGGGGGGLMGMSVRSGPTLLGASNNNNIGSYSGFNMSPAAMNSVRSSALSVSSGAMHQAPMNVTINNQSGAQVKTRRNEGELTIDIIEEVVADRLTRGGNKIDSAMQRAFGARRVGY